MTTAAADTALNDLLEVIFRRYHYDFKGYSVASIGRRANNALRVLGFESLGDLAKRVDSDPLIFSRLLQFLTVQVSDLFRDPSYFAAARQRIVPILRTYPSLKLWIAGCAAGEEAYSFAILLREEGLLDRALIYATDINPEGLRRAREGVYPLSRIPVFAENHRQSGATTALTDHYTARYDAAVFDVALRRKIVFSDHSLATDSVFAEVQLVSCRNVLIYFDSPLQSRAVQLFAESLCRKGFLGLGSRESLRFSPHRDSFSAFAPEVRWYRKEEHG